MTTGKEQRLRQRRLAGDKRAGAWARGHARRKQYEFVRRNWKLLLIAATVMLLPLAVALPLIPAGFPRGFVTGAVTATVGAVIVFAVVQMTGTAPVMMGDNAEQWTASELRKLRRTGWRVVNGVRLGRPDIDHVLVGPGGAFAVETKWSASTWGLVPPEARIAAAARQAAANARELRLWHPFHAAGITDVQPVVMLWGTGLRRVPAAQTAFPLNGAMIVPGPAARSWRTTLGSGVLTPTQVGALWQALDEQVRRRDPADAAKVPIPPSILTLITKAGLAMFGAIGGCLAVLRIVMATGSEGWWALPVVGLAALGIGLHQIRTLRYLASAFVFGVAAAVVLLALSLGGILPR